jgi:hypothetical protein
VRKTIFRITPQCCPVRVNSVSLSITTAQNDAERLMAEQSIDSTVPPEYEQLACQATPGSTRREMAQR